jgi:lipopolysaccharide biosynthesis protein
MNITKDKIRAIAMYLPQFHPITENDDWWGKGFTEWTNVTKAKPAFRGHYQPHLPTDLGFYDLRLPEVRELQAQMAIQYGIHGFCYYHYWFNGKRLLNRPFDEVLSSGKPDFPFCLCWANENWNRRWDGREGNVLIRQNYTPEDDTAHIKWLINAFRDERYIRIDGKPLFIIYRISQLPDPIATIQLWREEAIKHGIGEIYICGVEGIHPHTYTHISEVGLDAVLLIQPSFSYLSKQEKIFKRLSSYMLNRKGHMIYDYAKFSRHMMSLNYDEFKYPVFPCVTPAWDNTARRKKDGFIFTGSSPDLYELWLKNEVEKIQGSQSQTDKIIFINAWNEWAEGNHLEPCIKWGHSYLEATKKALGKLEQQQ